MKLYVNFKRILLIDGWDSSCTISLIWMSLDFTDDQSTLVQSHYLAQCWPRSLSPYGITRPQWVMLLKDPNWVVSYIAHTKLHSPMPVFHPPSQIFNGIGERASASFSACSSALAMELRPCTNLSICKFMQWLIQVMAWSVFGAKSLPEPLLT